MAKIVEIYKRIHTYIVMGVIILGIIALRVYFFRRGHPNVPIWAAIIEALHLNEP